MRKEEGSSLVWLGLAVLICIGSLRLSLGSFQNPGPGFFPFIAGLVLGTLAVTVYFQARRAAASARETSRPLWASPSGVKKVVLTTIALHGLCDKHELFGLPDQHVHFSHLSARTIEPQRWGMVILESLLASGISYLVFEIWLQAQLPRGIFL